MSHYAWGSDAVVGTLAERVVTDWKFAGLVDVV